MPGVLVVDNDPDTREILQKILTVQGHNAIVASGMADRFGIAAQLRS